MYQRVGTQLGNFHIKHLLGAGGMAAVYYATDQATQQPVALKILSAQLADIPAFRQRFELEAQITSRLEHPHIVPVVAYGAVDDALYIAMRYLGGGTLHDRFVVDGQVSLQATVRYLQDVAAGLDYAHTQGIIHRDIKLANVLLDENGRALLSDFGIAQMLESSLHLTESGSVLGSPHYMSPEQNEGKTLSPRSDLYSLAVVVFLMVTGQFPFHADTPVAIALQHVTKEPPLPTWLNPELPAAIDAVILKGLSKAPADRYPTAAEFAYAFQRAAGDCDTRTVVNLPQLSLSRVTPSRPPSPDAMQAFPAFINEPTSPSTNMRRRGKRFGALVLLIAVAVALFIALQAGLNLFGRRLFGGGQPTPVPPITATPLPITIRPSAQVITATFMVSPVTGVSPFTVIIRGIDRPSNVRNAPNLTASVLTQMYVTDSAYVIARTANSTPEQVWYLVRTRDGQVGWVKGDVVELLPIGSLPADVMPAVTEPAPPATQMTPRRITPIPSKVPSATNTAVLSSQPSAGVVISTVTATLTPTATETETPIPSATATETASTARLAPHPKS